jgi:hypothetical protein
MQCMFYTFSRLLRKQQQRPCINFYELKNRLKNQKKGVGSYGIKLRPLNFEQDLIVIYSFQKKKKNFQCFISCFCIYI